MVENYSVISRVIFFVSSTLELSLAKLMAHRDIFVAHVSNLKLWLLSAYYDKPEIAQLLAQLSLMSTFEDTTFQHSRKV